MHTVPLLAAALVLSLPAWGQDPPPPEVSPSEVPSPTAAAPAEIASAAELIETAKRRIEEGDYEGARILLEQSLGRADADPDVASYLIGMSWELQGVPEQAIALYDEGLVRWPESALRRNRLFRKAESLAAAERYAEALALLEEPGIRDAEGDDRLKVSLVRGMWTIGEGREEKGLELLGQALAIAGPDQVTWYQAKARASIARVLAAKASGLGMDVREKKMVDRLTRRIKTLSLIERQVTEAAELQEPEWVLDGVLTLGGAYESLGQDLLTSRRPRKLTEDQVAIYDEAIEDKVGELWVKALRTYELGLEMAGRTQWESHRVDEIAAAKEAVGRRIETL